MKISAKEVQSRRVELREDLAPLRVEAGKYGYTIRYGKKRTAALGFYIENKEKGLERFTASISDIPKELGYIAQENNGKGVEETVLCMDCGVSYKGNTLIECGHCGSKSVIKDGGNEGEESYISPEVY